MKFGDTFTIEYEIVIPNLNGTIRVSRDGAEDIVFKHYLYDINGDVPKVPRARFRNMDGKELEVPHIEAPSAQSACGEAMKIAVDRLVASLIAEGNDPFAREES